MGARPIGLFDPTNPQVQRSAQRARHRQTIRASQQVATWAVRATRLGRLYPDAPAGVILSAAQAGMDPSSEQTRLLMEQAIMQNPPPQAEKPPGASKSFWGKAGDFVGGIDDAALSVVKPVVRGGFTAIQSPLEELQGFVNAAGYANIASRDGNSLLDKASSLANFALTADGRENFWEVFNDQASVGRRVLGSAVSGEGVDLGEGFFAGGEIAEARKREAERWQIDGHAISVGRVVADDVFEPGSIGYNTLSGVLDGAVALAADPADIALRSASLAAKGRRTFFDVPDVGVRARAAERLGDLSGLRNRAGLVDVDRRQVIQDRAVQWLDNEASLIPLGDGTTGSLLEKLAEADDFLETYNFLGRRVRPTAVADLIDAQDVGSVRDVLLREITETGQLRNKIPAGGSTFLNRRLPSVAQSRVFDMMPRTQIDFDDMDDAVEQARRWMVNAKVDDATQSQILGDLVRTESRADMFKVAKGMFGHVSTKLSEEFGVPRSVAQKLTTSFTDDIERMAASGVSELSEEAGQLGIRIGGDTQQLMSPFLYNQLLSRGIPLPDPGEIRTMMSDWGNVLNNPLVRKSTTALEFLQDKIWKRTVLLRGAWTVRVVGEEQLRIAGAGGVSFFSHPIEAFKWVTGRRGKAMLGGEDFAGVEENFAEGLRKARTLLFSEDADELAELGFKPGFDWLRNKDAFFEAMPASKLREVMNAAAMGEADDLSKALARGSMGLTDADRRMSRFTQVVDQSDPVYFDGLVDELATLSNDPVARRVARGRTFESDPATSKGGIEGVKQWFRTSAERKELANAVSILETDQGADNYIDWLAAHINSRTGNSKDLRKLIGTRPAATDPKLARQLRSKVDEMDPNELPAEVLADLAHRPNAETGLLDTWDRATQSAFTGLMSVPTNKLSRSPFFRQKYWQRVEEMAPLADADTAAQIVADAKRANLGDDALRRIEDAAQGAGDLDLEKIDTIAKGFGLDETRDLLYDLQERRQFFDMYRLVFPFGDAWQEVMTRWAKIGRENPQVARRFQQTIQGAREGGGFVSGNEGGFITRDDKTGEEKFVYPGSRFLTERLLGVPISLTGRVAGLNMVGEIMPGFGPVVQIPTAALLPDSPDLDWVNDLVNPFGDPEFTGGVADFLPSWANKLRTAGVLPVLGANEGQQRLWQSTVGSTMEALALTGNYDLHGPNAREETARLFDDAKQKAKGLYILRAGAQFISPTAPSPELLAEVGPEGAGRLMVMQEIADDFRELQNEDRDTALEKFLQKYGEYAFVLTEGKTTGIFGVSKEVEDWARRNPDILEKYPEVYAFFGPTPPDDETFDYDTYRRQIARGERIPRDPEEILHAAQHRLAKAQLDALDAAIPGQSHAKTLARKRLQQRLVERYEGYRPFDLSSDLEQTMVSLRRATNDPKLMDTRLAGTLRKYFAIRDIFDRRAEEMGVKDFSSANRTQPLRDALRLIAVRLGSQDPGFNDVWNRILVHELRGREEEVFEEEVGVTL